MTSERWSVKIKEGLNNIHALAGTTNHERTGQNIVLSYKIKASKIPKYYPTSSTILMVSPAFRSPARLIPLICISFCTDMPLYF
jgi:hypothetical protein